MQARTNWGFRHWRRGSPPPAGPTHDTPSKLTFNVAGPTYALTHTVPAGAAYLEVRLAYEKNNAGKSITSVVSDVGGALTVVQAIWSANAAGLEHAVYVLPAPAAGVHTITLTLASASVRVVLEACAITGASSYTSAPPAGTNTTTPSVSIASAAGRLVLGSIAYLNTNQTLTYTGAGSSFDDTQVAAADTVGTRQVVYAAAGATSVTFGGTLSGGTDWAGIAVSYAP